jgi:hypothetical protein
MYSGPSAEYCRALIDRLQVVVSHASRSYLSWHAYTSWRTGSDKVGLGTRAIKLSSNRVTGWVEAEATRWKEHITEVSGAGYTSLMFSEGMYTVCA